MSEKFITRSNAPAYIREKFGVPVSKSTFNKNRMFGKPKPDAYYGGKELFLPKTLDAFTLEELVSDKPTKLIPEDDAA